MGGVHAVRVPLVLLALLVALFLPVLAHSERSGLEEDGILVIATLTSFAKDIEFLCDDRAQVLSIPPAGVDPHTYSLRPQDYERLRRADVIVTTLHTPFEYEVDRLVAQGELKPEAYIVAYEVPGIALLENPMGKPNLHGFLYSPENYVAVIRYIAGVLVELDETGRSLYTERARILETRALEAMRALEAREELVGIASTPIAQYVGEALKIQLALMLTWDPEVPPTPKSLEHARRLLESGTVSVALISGVAESQGEVRPYTAYDRALLELARTAKIPIIVIPPPTVDRPLVEIIEQIASSHASVTTSKGGSMPTGTRPSTVALLALGAAAVLAAASVVYKTRSRRGM